MNVKKAAVTAVLLACTGSMAFAQHENKFSMNDRQWLKNSGIDNIEELDLATLALSKTQDPDIRQFAQRMQTDHQQLIDQSKPVDEAAKVLPPTPQDKTKAEMRMRDLQKMSGKEFDNGYIELMVMDHQKDLKKAKMEAADTKNDQVKTLASGAADVIQQHLQMIEQIAQSHHVSVPMKAPKHGACSTM